MTPTERLREVNERALPHPGCRCAGCTGQRAASALTRPEAVEELARVIDPEFWNARVRTSPVYDRKGKPIGAHLEDSMTLAEYEAHPSRVKARACLDHLSAQALGETE